MKNSSHPIIFISHAYSDRETAQTLTRYLILALKMVPQDIRCSSVINHMLAVGEDVVSQLNEDIGNSTCFIVLFSHFGRGSAWVKYETGAAWGLQKDILPILGPGTKATDKKAGPLATLLSISVEDDQCASILTHYFRQVAQKLGRTLIETPIATEKLIDFINTYRNWGGIHADFSHVQASILLPANEATVEKLISVTVDLSEAAPEEAHIWVAITNASSRQLWPKEMLTDPQRPGKHTIEISENGTPAPGELGVCLLGVGETGHIRIKAWLAESEKTGNWSGLKPDSIPGLVELACVSGLTLVKTSHL